MKKLRLLGALCAVLLSAIPYGTAHAISIRLDFEATNFTDSPSGAVIPAPVETVGGSFLYEAASINSTIDYLTGINLTIYGHSYSLAEVDITTTGTSLVFQCIGEDPADGCSIGGSGRDFILEWTTSDNKPQQFAYSVDNINEYWTTDTFTRFDIQPVPVPPALLLFGSGLVGLIGVARRKQAA